VHGWLNFCILANDPMRNAVFQFVFCPLLILVLLISTPGAFIVTPGLTLEDSRPWYDEEPERLGEIALFDKRIFNFVFDGALFLLFRIAFSELILQSYQINVVFVLTSFFLWFLYYPAMEYAAGKTLAKYISQTRVVNDDLTSIDFGVALKRNLLRLVPFEMFSFLKRFPTGWHDSFSGTLVINDHRPADSVQWVEEEC
jgi:uncharacterized RDD family membrane protein YckC